MDKKEEGRTRIILFIALIALAIAIPIILASDFDNVLSYEKKGDDNYKVATFTNAFGLGEEIAKVELITPKLNYVIQGKNRRVMEFDIENLGDSAYANGFGDMIIKNLKTNEEETKPYHFEYAIYDLVDSPIYEDVCTLEKGITNCESNIVGKEKVNKIVGWNDLNGKDIPKGKTRIALVVDVNEGDYYDGIPTLFGQEVSAWATWSASLDIGLISYWDLNELTGNTISDKKGVHNLEMNGTGIWTEGRLDNGFNCTFGNGGVGAVGNNTAFTFVENELNATINMTINFWIYKTALLTDTRGIIASGNLANANEFLIYYMGTNLDNVTFGITNYTTEGLTQNRVPTLGLFVPIQEWNMFSFVINGTFETSDVWASVYQNGTFIESRNVGNYSFGFAGANGEKKLMLFGHLNDDLNNLSDNVVDEIGIWNRGLTGAEIEQLWNNGIGLEYHGGTPDVFLNEPSDLHNVFSATTINFNCTTEITTSYLIRNLSLWIDDNIMSETINGVDNFSEIYYSNSTIELGTHNWTCLAYEFENNNSAIATNRTFTISHWLENFQSYNSSTFETKKEAFDIDFNYSTLFTPTIELVYNETYYDGIVNGTFDTNGNFYKAFNAIPLQENWGSYENRSFYWRLKLTDGVDTYWYNSTTQYQMVEHLNVSICSEPDTTQFLNFSFQDESDSTPINATITNSWAFYLGGDATVNRTNLYVSATEQGSYNFCYNASEENLTLTGTSMYNAAGYVSREKAIEEIYNSTTSNQILYLLSSSDGIVETIMVLNYADQPINNVWIIAERQFAGVYETVDTGFTGDDGTVSFWLNPDYLHRITATHSSYGSTTTTFYPSTSGHTIYLGGGEAMNNQTYNFYGGISIEITPLFNPMILSNNTIYDFKFHINSTYWALDNFGFTMTNGSYPLGSVIVSGEYTGGEAALSLFTGNNKTLFMNYWWDVDGNATNGTISYMVTDIPDEGFGLTKFFEDLKTYIDDEIFGINRFTVVLIIFLLIFTIVGIVSYSFGIYNPTAIMWLIFLLVAFFDVVVDLLPEPAQGYNGSLTIICGLIALTLTIREATR